MNELAEKNQQGVAISDDTKALITSGVSENTLRIYRYWSRQIEAWLGRDSLMASLGYSQEKRTLSDVTLAEYITGLHRTKRASVSSCMSRVIQGVSSSGIKSEGALKPGHCSVRSDGVIISRRAGSRLGRHVVRLPIGQNWQGWKGSSVGTPFVSAQVGASVVDMPVLVGGNRQLCQRIMPKRSWQSRARLYDKKKVFNSFLQIVYDGYMVGFKLIQVNQNYGSLKSAVRSSREVIRGIGLNRFVIVIPMRRDNNPQ